MPLIEVTLTQGREPAKIRSLISALTDAVVTHGRRPQGHRARHRP
jgi:phenylpyruvate tautomerase PptA (4-oxalocrotonate tautomerase family)